MTFERVLIRLLLNGRLRRLGKKLLRHRVWTVQQGEAYGLKLRLPQNLDYLYGSSEIPVQRALVEHLRPGRVFYDIGANMGFFSLIAARQVGASGSVHSFEPLTENAAHVRANAKLNQFENIHVHDVAVGGASRMEELHLTAWDGGIALGSSAIKTVAPLSTRKVRVVELDQFVQDRGLLPPAVVKIDVEGAELEVMQGMAETIARAKPIIVYEVDDGNSESFQRRWKELDEYIISFGYTVTHLEASYRLRRWHVGHSLAAPKEFADRRA